MEKANAIGTFAINVNQEMLQDLFDIEDQIDQIVEGLCDVKAVPHDVWLAISGMRESLDNLRYRSLIIPPYIHKIEPNTHKVDLTKVTTTTP